MLSAVIDLERLLPQALEALLRATGATSGCSFTYKAAATPILHTLIGSEDNLHAEKLADVISHGLPATSGFCLPGSHLWERLLDQRLPPPPKVIDEEVRRAACMLRRANRSIGPDAARGHLETARAPGQPGAAAVPGRTPGS